MFSTGEIAHTHVQLKLTQTIRKTHPAEHRYLGVYSLQTQTLGCTLIVVRYAHTQRRVKSRHTTLVRDEWWRWWPSQDRQHCWRKAERPSLENSSTIARSRRVTSEAVSTSSVNQTRRVTFAGKMCQTHEQPWHDYGSKRLLNLYEGCLEQLIGRP